MEGADEQQWTSHNVSTCLSVMPTGNDILYLLRRNLEVQRGILQDFAYKTHPGEDRIGLLTRAQAMDDVIEAIRHTETDISNNYGKTEEQK